MSFIYYSELPFNRTSCYMCDWCTSPLIDRYLIRLRGFYTGTQIPVSYLYKTDLQSYHWSEPLCNLCSIEWTKKYKKIIQDTIISSVQKIQKWYLHNLYRPGGKKYKEIKERFENRKNTF